MHCIVGETSRYLTTLVAVPAINISFYLRISCLFSLFSIVKTIEPNLVYGSCLFTLDKIHLGSPYILIPCNVGVPLQVVRAGTPESESYADNID